MEQSNSFDADKAFLACGREIFASNPERDDRLRNDISYSPQTDSSSGSESGSPSGSWIPRSARKSRTPSCRGLPST